MASCPRCFQEKPLFADKCPNCTADVPVGDQVRFSITSTIMVIVMFVLLFGFLFG